jgi:hypothetical protein
MKIRTMRGCLSVVLVSLLCANSVDARPKMPAAFRDSQTTQKPALKEQVLLIPAGSVVEVRLKTKEKLRGRLGEVSNEALIVKMVKADKIDERKIAFDDVKSVKLVEHGSKAGKTALYILAGVGVGLVILFAIFAVALRNS